MTKKELIEELSQVSGELDNYPGDTSLITAIRDLRQIHLRLDEIIQRLENEDVVEEREEL